MDHVSEMNRATCSTMEVLTYQGATELTLILSLAHSQAKFLVSWLIAPENGGKN